LLFSLFMVQEKPKAP